MKRVQVVGAVLVLMALAPACRPRVVFTPVEYLGHDDEVVAPRRVPTKRVFIEVDASRVNSSALGEDAAKHVPITGDPNAVARMVLEGFRTEFAHVGIPLAQSRADADRLLRVVLTSVKVQESVFYQADLKAVLEVSTREGAPMGRTEADGIGLRYGDDYSAEEVNCALNNALAKLIAGALGKAEFLRLLGN